MGIFLLIQFIPQFGEGEKGEFFYMLSSGQGYIQVISITKYKFIVSHAIGDPCVVE